MDQSTINAVGIDAQMEPNVEQVQTTDDALYPKITPEEFSMAIDKQLQRIEMYEGEIRLANRQKLNKRYYEGNQLDTSSLRDDQEKWVENDILKNIEALIPIYTSRVPSLTATPSYKNEKTRGYAGDVRRALQTEWEVKQHMQQQVSKGIRNHQKNLVAVFQLGYDPKTDEFWTEEIPATEVKISKNKDFLVRYIKNKDLGYLLDTFPDKVNQIKSYYGWGEGIEVTKKMRSSPVTYIEAWTNEVVGWRLGQDCVLGVEPNPHWDEEGEDYQGVDADPTTGQPSMGKVYFNYLKAKKMPFLFLYHINTTGHAYDDTTLLEQAIGPQNWINKRKRQIGENADAANGVWVTSGDFISEEEFMKIEGGINEKIWLQNGNPANGIARITGNSLEDFVYNDLLDSRNSLNEIMGVSAATLGTKTQNDTLGKDVMDRQQNLSRADGYVRDAIERFAQEWYEYMYHLYLVYRKDETSIAIPDDADFESENITFSHANVPIIQKNDGSMVCVPLLLQVKQGSTLPQDEVMEYNRANQNKDVMSKIDYFKKIGEPNPRELAKNFLIESMDPTWFFKDDPDIVQLTQAVAQKAMMAKQAASGVPGEQVPAIEDRTNSQDGPTPEGVGNALRAEFQARGMNPNQAAVN